MCLLRRQDQGLLVEAMSTPWDIFWYILRYFEIYFDIFWYILRYILSQQCQRPEIYFVPPPFQMPMSNSADLLNLPIFYAIILPYPTSCSGFLNIIFIHFQLTDNNTRWKPTNHPQQRPVWPPSCLRRGKGGEELQHLVTWILIFTSFFFSFKY